MTGLSDAMTRYHTDAEFHALVHLVEQSATQRAILVCLLHKVVPEGKPLPEEVFRWDDSKSNTPKENL